ncbi:MAG: gliding motility protein GldL [Prevotellaceae bacterium]|jgi:gliding motility-associated protein GldL|nr:gliding motility protein GldL [Prevotellaceae bacterium]
MVNFFDKPAFQKLIHVAYGFGAALVIVGALFKLQHWTGAGIMLTIGMLTEFFIFILSALEAMPKKYNWENVYPELVANGDVKHANANRAKVVNTNTSSSPQLDFNFNIEQSQVNNIKDGLNKLNDSLKNLASLSAVSQGSQQLASTLINANQAVANVANTSNALSETYATTAKIVTSFADETQRGIENSKKAMYVYGEHINTLSKNIGAINSSVELQLSSLNKTISAVNSSFELQLNTLNKTMGNVTSSFELQLKDNQQYQQAYGLLNKEVISLVADVKKSVQSSAELSVQMKSLTENVSRLNSVYGNMLTAITNLR